MNDLRIRRYLLDIVEHAELALSFLENIRSAADLARDRKTLFAVIRALEVMGEASKRIPEDLRRRHPEIPWRAMSGMRDRLIHRYSGVDVDLVFSTVKNVLPEVLDALARITGRLDR